MAVEIGFLGPDVEDDVVGGLVGLVNRVYAASEEGLWRGRVDRTGLDEMAGLVRAGEIAVARVGGRIVGVVRVQRLDGET
ncbi:GNAT family N-acetyltransferase, partial [Actinomadura adrarensis]